jgi:hypothetical protein
MIPHTDDYWKTAEAEERSYYSYQQPPSHHSQHSSAFERHPAYQDFEPPRYRQPAPRSYPQPHQQYQPASWYDHSYHQHHRSYYQHPHPPAFNQAHHPETHDPSLQSSPPDVVYLQRDRSSSPGLVFEIKGTDVLCGRGAPTNWHEGNQYFRQLVNKHQAAYLAAKRVEKPEIAILIVQLVKERGGRFLKRTKRPGLGPSGHFGWQEIDEHRAYEKVCQALREGAPDLRRKLAVKKFSSPCVGERGGDEHTREHSAEV